MSMRYKGAVISATPPTTSTTTATGIWTLPQQLQAQGAGNWPLVGPFTYIEDVFSTYLYTGNGSTQTIINGINLSGNGGLVWFKNRGAATNNLLLDTVRGTGSILQSNLTNGNVAYTGFGSFNNNGFSLNVDPGSGINASSNTYVSWTFREQPKFFDIVTYTGNDISGRTISHNLGSVPGCIIVKCLNDTDSWYVYHQSLGNTKYIVLNQTVGADTASTLWNNTSPTATNFTLGGYVGVNGNGLNYIAYLFAHNAGGFGLTGNDNVISCGSFTTDGSGNATVNLGYEPQWILYKNITSAENWFVRDVLRGWSKTTNSFLSPNTTSSDTFTSGDYTSPNATGFQMGPVAGAVSASSTYIYIAIRRGPMKVPTVGTSVFSPISSAATVGTAITTNFPIDLQTSAQRTGNFANTLFSDRLRGINSLPNNVDNKTIQTASTAAETTYAITRNMNNTGYEISLGWSGANVIYWNFRRAPGFFDEVCYTGIGATNLVLSHNLTVTPELIIWKKRNNTMAWYVNSSVLTGGFGTANGVARYLSINTTDSENLGNFFGDALPNATSINVYPGAITNASGSTYVAYLFATCPGVSKVGSYSGTGVTQTIDCGFTGGARFVLIKRTDTTGDWYVWDTARGMVAGTDPSLLLNTTAAEVNANSVYTTGVGFQIVSTAAGINASGGTYIFWAVA